MVHFVYIIYSPGRDQYYIGSSQDVFKRLDDHNNSRSNFTKGTSDWELKWHQSFADKTEALKMELMIKRKKSRVYILKLIERVSVG
jgi:putative endonuclease